MFKSIKKKKIQEVENVEKNENSSVNSENISENPESLFPDAKDTLEISKQKWKQATAEEILEEIKSESLKGSRYVRIYNSYISEELVWQLRGRGYRVEVHPLPGTIGPYFEIYW